MLPFFILSLFIIAGCALIAWPFIVVYKAQIAELRAALAEANRRADENQALWFRALCPSPEVAEQLALDDPRPAVRSRRRRSSGGRW